MEIQGKKIGQGQPVFIIAEIGMNHNGVFDNAIKLIDQAKDCEVDCVKFQRRNLDQVYTEEALDMTSSDLSTQYTLDLLKRFELTFDEHQKLADYAKSLDLMYMCTPWDKKSVDELEKIGVPGYKVASADFTNSELISYLAKTKKPLLFSTGMCGDDEINEGVRFLKSLDIDFALLHTNSTYPSPFKDIQLNYLKRLAQHGVPIGYSGHERGTAVSIASVALGVNIIERHFTLDRTMEGPDHAASLEKEEFKRLVEGIRQVETSLGDEGERRVSQGEIINRENLAKSIFANEFIKAGTPFSNTQFILRSPGKGLNPQYLSKIEGLIAKRDIQKGECLYLSDIESGEDVKKEYNFKHRWGIPVRYHDVSKLLENAKPDFLEFHVSYTDLEEDLSKFLKKTYDCGFVMHVPELFKNEHLLDLCTSDDAYRQESIDNLQQVINLTRDLKAYFPSEKRPYVVIHCGGFTMDSHLPDTVKPGFYERLEQSLNALDSEGVELLPENMAPFPWHFGGQRFQNIFVNADEIVEFCNKTGYRICQDVSHSKLACTHFGWDHVEYTRKLAPLTSHYHISDGEGVDGEGLQIGEGKISFNQIGDILNTLSPNASFITEVWQGHKNDGEGFWKSLAALEAYI